MLIPQVYHWPILLTNLRMWWSQAPLPSFVTGSVHWVAKCSMPNTHEGLNNIVEVHPQSIVPTLRPHFNEKHHKYFLAHSVFSMHDAWDGILYLAVGMLKIYWSKHAHQKFVLLLSLKCRLQTFMPLSITSFCAQKMQGKFSCDSYGESQSLFSSAGWLKVNIILISFIMEFINCCQKHCWIFHR